jgi:hypothetical protein
VLEKGNHRDHEATVNVEAGANGEVLDVASSRLASQPPNCSKVDLDGQHNE